MSDPLATVTSPDERGMILINVLVIVMLATSVLAIMLAGQDSVIERSLSAREAAQAMAIARGGELSAVVALRRDLASGSSSDSLAEPWANIAEHEQAIAGGTFSFAVSDAQARFNINAVARGDAVSSAMFGDVAAAAGLSPAAVERITALLHLAGPVDDLSAFRTAGLSDDELAKLAQFCTALPEQTSVNLNTAPEVLIAALANNPDTARRLVALRGRSGGLTSAALSAANLIAPIGTGLSSDYFWARSRVTMGGTAQAMTSLLHRHLRDGRPAVDAIRRWRGRAPLEAPALAR